MQPGIPSAHPPARLIRNHAIRVFHGLTRLIVGQANFGRRSQYAANTCGPPNLNPEHFGKELCAFSVRKPQPLIQHDQRCMGVRTQLARGRPEGIARLQWMPALNSTAATRAATDVDGKLTANGTARNLRLMLLGDARFLDIPPATMRTAVRQGCIVPLVDSRRRNRGAVGVRSVGSSRLAARLLWGRLGTLGLPERGRLAFGCSKQFLNSGFQQLNPRLTSLEAPFQTN